ncbi:hypothetical protein SRHO_G00042480 [Serrasalmus rhombeus]
MTGQRPRGRPECENGERRRQKDSIKRENGTGDGARMADMKRQCEFESDSLTLHTQTLTHHSVAMGNQ